MSSLIRGGRPNAKVKFITAKTSILLGQLLTLNFPKINVQKVICSGGVWKNTQRITTPGTKINAGETIKVYLSPTQGYSYLFSKDLILSETKDWVVVYKEPLITVAMDRSNMHFNLMAGLNHYYGFQDYRQGVQPITRLDYRVGGLCLFSKHKNAERRLFMQMQQRRIKKRYIAVVNSNEPRQVRCAIINNISHKRQAFIDPLGKYAKTFFVYHKLKCSRYHLYHAITKTGRRHQVRFHASLSIGALVNDELYSSKYNDRHAPIGLIANELRFIWNGQKINIKLPENYIDQTLGFL
ncbi:MAG: pseudouridine synthase [Candidatus Margulisiibacteriota bacterium]